MQNGKAYGKNIRIEPKSKNKIIGDTSKYFLYGTVLDVGEEVKTIKVGDTIGYIMWGINKIEFEDKSEHFFVQDNSDFILEVFHV